MIGKCFFTDASGPTNLEYKIGEPLKEVVFKLQDGYETTLENE